MTVQSSCKPITELQKIMLEILLENNQMGSDELVKEALKRQQRIKNLRDIK